MQHTHIKRHGKWRRIYKWLIILLVLILVGFLIFRGCQITCEKFLEICFPEGRGEWEYPLPNGYRVVVLNFSEICICSSTGDSTSYHICIESYIFGFCFNSRYIGAIRIVPAGDSITDAEIRLGEREYYLLDTDSGTYYGPYTEEEYQEQCDVMGVTGMCDWIYSKDVRYDNVPTVEPIGQ